MGLCLDLGFEQLMKHQAHPTLRQAMCFYDVDKMKLDHLNKTSVEYLTSDEYLMSLEYIEVVAIRDFV